MTHTPPIAKITADTTAVHTSLAQLFTSTQIEAIEIPLIQRDYAQGRRSPQVDAIRKRFLDSLCDALEKPEGINLDFVFGDLVELSIDKKKVPTFYPLDGQQRLTTLFLLHCYLAWHLPETAGIQQPWHAFHYATRPGARAFCQFLTSPKCCPDICVQSLSEWLCDQADYLPTWKHDPTIQGMLVVLDELHERYRKTPTDTLRAAWLRLIDPQQPAIRFHLLPIRAHHLDNSLYVKMNSRGKPLTAFENFKAELEGLLRNSPHIPNEMLDEFSRKIDTEWADLFWHYRGNNDLIDEEFMRYLRFLAEVLAWKQNLKVNHLSTNDAQELARLAHELFGPGSTRARECLDWMTQALNIWLEDAVEGVRKPRPVQQLFEKLFTRTNTPATTPLRVFNFRDFDEQQIGVDMLRACCDLYGTRPWRLAHTLLFYGVLHGLTAKVPQESSQLHLRLRLLRNLIEASQDEIRAGDRNNMPELLREVESIVADGPLDHIKTFNQVQVTNESDKRAFLQAHPMLQETLHRLEDHELLRGGLTVFDLDPAQIAATFKNRVAQLPTVFAQPYIQAAGALLAKGHEGRSMARSSGHRLAYLGAPRQSEPWENLFRARKGEKPHPSSAALMALLDDLTTGAVLPTILDIFTSHQDTPKDWRYYLVKYPVMRSGVSGWHVIGPGAGYALCMLKGESCDNRSYHFDPYLLALVQKACVASEHIGNDGWPRCFPGYETEERHLVLRNCGIKIQCVDSGWQFSDVPVTGTQQRSIFDGIAKNYSHYQDQIALYAVPQNNGIDTEDRIELGSLLLQELVTEGL